MRRVIVALCSMLLLAAALAPVAAAKTIPPILIRGVIDMATYMGPSPEWSDLPTCPVVSMQKVLDPTGCWYGKVTGDMSGTIAFWEDPAGVEIEKGKTLKFFEKFTFWPSDGKGWVIGYDVGFYDLVTGAFRASGWVTGSSAGEWSALRGRWFYEWGTTSDPSVLPITSPATQFIITKTAK
jgi:hypothetical protein